MSRKVLGKGLGALIPGAEETVPGNDQPGTVAPPVASPPPAPSGVPVELPISQVASNPYQPRSTFDHLRLEELAQSIKANGVLQPVLVRPAPDGNGYQLIAGERRFLAAGMAGRTSVPAFVRQASRKEMLEFALIENLQREDLNPIEEAQAYQRMATEFDLTQEQIAQRVGKDRATVSNTLRLLNLSPAVQDLVSRGTLTTGHARCLLSIETASDQEAFANEVVKRGLSVRQVEELMALRRQKRGRVTPRRHRVHPTLADWEDKLRRTFGTQVRIVGGTARGRVEVSYFNESDLERILEVVGILGPSAPGS